MRNKEEADRAISVYSDTVRRICFMHLKNYSDVEDVFQEVFLKYLLYEEPFESDAHEKAWLIRVSINSCRDLLKSFFRRKVCSIEEMSIEPYYVEDDKKELLDLVLRLPKNYKDVIYLFYYEGYSAVEIAKILGKKENTVYTWLSRARERLRLELGGMLHEK